MFSIMNVLASALCERQTSMYERTCICSVLFFFLALLLRLKRNNSVQIRFAPAFQLNKHFNKSSWSCSHIFISFQSFPLLPFHCLLVNAKNPFPKATDFSIFYFSQKKNHVNKFCFVFFSNRILFRRKRMENVNFFIQDIKINAKHNKNIKI